MFSTVRIWLSAIAVGAFSVLLIAVRVLASKNAKLKIDTKIAVAKEKHTKKVLAADIAIDEQVDEHLAEVTKEIEEGKHPDQLLNPSDHWD
jgi:hypothetical protein